MIRVFQTFLFEAWILQHFPHNVSWASVPEYTKVMLRATTFIPLKGNQAAEPFRIYLNRLVDEDMDLNSYVDHRQMQPFDEIILYSG